MKQYFVFSLIIYIIIFEKTNAVWTSLHIAVYSNNECAVESILTQAQKQFGNWRILLYTQTEKGETPLHLAVIGGATAITKKLLEFGTSQNLYDSEGYLPIHHAAARENVGMCKLLLSYGATVNDRTITKETPLVVALRHKKFLTALFFVSHGTDVSTVPYNGLTAIYYAYIYGHEALVRLLAAKGADTKINVHGHELQIPYTWLTPPIIRPIAKRHPCLEHPLFAPIVERPQKNDHNTNGTTIVKIPKECFGL